MSKLQNNTFFMISNDYIKYMLEVIKDFLADTSLDALKDDKIVEWNSREEQLNVDRKNTKESFKLKSVLSDKPPLPNAIVPEEGPIKLTWLESLGE